MQQTETGIQMIQMINEFKLSTPKPDLWIKNQDWATEPPGRSRAVAGCGSLGPRFSNASLRDDPATKLTRPTTKPIRNVYPAKLEFSTQGQQTYPSISSKIFWVPVSVYVLRWTWSNRWFDAYYSHSSCCNLHHCFCLRAPPQGLSRVALSTSLSYMLFHAKLEIPY